MTCAKNYETVSKFDKVMPRILWHLYFRTRCIVYKCAKNYESRLAVAFFGLMVYSTLQRHLDYDY